MGHPSRGLRNSSALSSMDAGDPAQEDSIEYNISTGLDTMLVIFWKRICLLFALVLRICLKLNGSIFN